MKQLCAVVAALVLLTLSACTPTAPKDADASAKASFSDANKIPYVAGAELDGAAGVEREGDVQASPYYTQLDFYHMKSTDTRTILEQFKTVQQTTEWTCGPAAALMVLEWYGQRDGKGELDLVPLRGDPDPGATDLREMMNIFEGLGGWKLYSTYDLPDPDAVPEDMILTFLKEGKPILLGWDDWGGHWQVIIGYDTMGTETTADDVLILADPYDTTDHNQDGYILLPFERLYYNWLNGFDQDFGRNLFLVATPEA